MIHYALRCDQAHDFDGWFKDSATFERMAARKLVECPHCGGSDVSRALMAPAIGRGVMARASQDEVAAEVTAEPAARQVVAVPQGHVPGAAPAAMVAMLQRMRAEIEKRCDHVGPRFAEEARRMAAGESEARGIYGETTPDEAEALRDEGIGFETIPWLPRADG